MVEYIMEYKVEYIIKHTVEYMIKYINKHGGDI